MKTAIPPLVPPSAPARRVRKLTSTRTKHLFVRHGIYVVLQRIDGRQIWRSLHIEAHADNYRAAVDAARILKLQLRAEHYGGGIQRRIAERPASMIAEILAAYRASAAGSNAVSPTTVRNNCYSLLNVLRTAGEAETAAAAELLRATVLTPVLVQKYQEGIITAAKAAAEEEELDAEEADAAMQKRQNTILSTLRQARSLFKKDLLASHHYAKLVLPSTLAAFCAARVAGSSTRKFQPPAAEVLKAFLDGHAAQQSAQPALWLAVELAYKCALRRDSAIHAKWDWLTPNADGSVQFEIKVAKTGPYTIQISGKHHAALLAARQSLSPFLLPGEAEADRALIIDQVVAWLRSIGLKDEQKPYHYLRKMHGDYVDRTLGIEAAARRLGHANSTVTRAVYVEGRSRDIIDVV